MGNTVVASGAPPPPSSPSSSTPDPPKRNDNPGTFEEIHKSTKDVFPNFFEGGRLMMQRGLSNHFQVTHIINLSSTDPSGYRFGATYVGSKQLGPAESYPILLGDCDPSGNVSANLIHQFGERIRAKAAAQIQRSKYQATKLAADYMGDDFTASITLGNIDVLKGSGVVVGHYLQKITKSTSLGSEIAYQCGPMIPGGQLAVVSLAARYSGEKWTASGTLGGAGVHACYYQKCSDQLQMGVEFETNTRAQKCVASIGYQVDIPRADLVFRGVVDSDWNIGSTLEKKLSPLPFTLALCGQFSHTENVFRMGCAFVIG
ncbi:unnamed protein product [Notodromas monacha]|uniref:Mitochondrial import receptor subunit TOM40 homolog n=1 Tax=Notodromas monacha TaxID=399045 RepID=A0A7R9BR35_9CRUS|nr:unnamed protein product [Notodromas monacha]CAG0918770.1 unnamed protein product [Notodromas monacha]